MAHKRVGTIKQALTTAEFEILRKVVANPFEFAKFIFLIHPLRGKVLFELYPFQRSVLYQFFHNRFNIVLKFRQAGITELISLYCLWLAMYHPNKSVLIISIKERVSKKVLRKIKFMYKNLPDFLKVDVVNGRAGDYGTASEMEFANGSIISSIPTTEEAGRSEGLSLLVVDEAAIIKWANQIWASAWPTLSTGGSAIVNSCVTGDTNIVTRDGPLRIDTICPKSFGRKNISNLGIEVLSHTGQWRKILGAVNKGQLPTWEIVNNNGKVIKCTPDHKLLTTRGWLSVKEIIEKNLKAIFYDLGNDTTVAPQTKPPLGEIIKVIEGFPNYRVSNLGKIYIAKGDKLIEKKGSLNNWGYYSIRLWHKSKSQKFSRNRIVASHFIGEIPKGYVVDHINCIKTHDYVTNLQIITEQENSQRGAQYSRAHKIGAARGNKGWGNLQVIAYIQTRFKKYKGTKNYQQRIIDGCMDKFGVLINSSYITRIGQGKRNKAVYTSRLKIVRKYVDNIYDISVEEDMSYLTDKEYINHNTPYGVGNWFHNLWVGACSGGNPFVPIRLRWPMHPERDIQWYNDQKSVLGPRKTAQEIDGDFLTSGNTVFDLADIRAIEDLLLDETYWPIQTFMNGQLRIYRYAKQGEKCWIGADVSTGRSRDYSAFSIMNRSGEELASFKGKVPIDKLSDLLGKWGKKYNYAVVAPESNDIGLGVSSKLQRQGYRNLYYTTQLVKEKGQKNPKEEKVPGWLTTKKNRPVIIANLEEDIRNETVDIKDPRFIEEAYTFIYDERNKPIALGKGKSVEEDNEDDQVYTDDSILAKAITNQIRKGKHKSTVVAPQS